MSNATNLACDPATGTLYTVASGADLIAINPTTGVATTVGNAGLFSVSGLAFDTATSTLYAIGQRFLASIDPATGVGTSLGALAGSDGGQVQGLGIDPSTGLLLATTDRKQLLEIDPATRAATVAGDTGPTTVGGLAYRPER